MNINIIEKCRDILKHEYSTHYCESSECEGCECFIKTLRSSERGSEILALRFRSGASTTLGEKRVCTQNKEGRVVAVCDASFLDDGSKNAEIGFMTDPDFQRKGCAISAVKQMISELKTQGADTIIAVINENNFGAASLFASLGGAPEIDFLLDNRSSRNEVQWVVR